MRGRLGSTANLALGCYLIMTSFVFLSAEQAHNCDDVINDPSVKYFDIRLPLTEVPEELTTYVCYEQRIPLSMKDDYHAVAFEPIISRPAIMHHMILFGCPELHHDMKNSGAFSQTPHVCGGGDNRCRTFLMQWSMGIHGAICSPPDTGVRFGLTSLHSMALQIHWNNPGAAPGLADSSGVRVYYTTKLRKFDLGNVQVGQNDLEIPQGQGHYPQTGSCSSDCTRHWLTRPIYLTRAHIHMHYIGDGGLLELVRNGEVHSDVVRDDQYDYNAPPAHWFHQPVQVRPGDELRLTCYFNTRDGVKRRNRTVYWGEGSDGEMCYAFITYYPKIQHFDQCIQFDTYDICTETGFTALGECVFQGFIHTFESGMAGEIFKQCGNSSSSTTTSTNINKTNVRTTSRGKSVPAGQICSNECDQAIKEVTEHPCMQGRLGKKTRREYLPQVDAWNQVKHILDTKTRLCTDS